MSDGFFDVKKCKQHVMSVNKLVFRVKLKPVEIATSLFCIEYLIFFCLCVRVCLLTYCLNIDVLKG